MSEENRETCVEQAAVALLAEAQAQGIDLQALGEKAKTGIIGGAEYRWVSDAVLANESTKAVDYLISSTLSNFGRN
ncbi:hypothetical protein [Alcaligenes sp. Marseille-Q7550]